ncbi:MAG TPA: MFS transporter [Ktedonobacteraceae bacterium]|jgi:MFS family permease
MARLRSEHPDTRAFAAADDGSAGSTPVQLAQAETVAQAERPITPLYRTGFLLTSMVAGLSSVCIKQLLLPIQVGFLAPQQTNTAFAIVSSLGALAGLLAAPIAGALSDRTVSRWGRRRPWIGGGTLVGVAGLLLMALSPNIPLLLVGEILEQLGVDAVLANVTALIPDQVPERQRATMSALNGMAPIVGGVLGLVLVTALTNPRVVEQGYLLLMLASCLCVVVFLCVLREPSLAREMVGPFHLRTFLASFLRPLTSRNFAFTLLSRLMVFLAFTLLGSYLLFYLRAGLHAPIERAAQGVTTFQLISTTVLIGTALLASVLSRRRQRLKPFVICGALLMALGVEILAVSPTWTALWIGAAFFGAGFGSYLGIDIALAVRVLPGTAESGKDLGIIYTAIFLPLIITPLIGAFILNVFQENFAVLFSIAALASVCAALLILPIRAVR